MRPITKLLLLLIVALFVYVLWPRTPDLTAFKPEELASLKIEAWKGEKKGGFAELLAIYRIYSGQYGFTPIASFMIAQNQVAAIGKLKQGIGDAVSEGAALPALQEKYAIIKRETKLDFDSDSLAREELGWRVDELDGSTVRAMARPLQVELAAFYHLPESVVAEVAANIAGARALLQGTTTVEDVTNPDLAAMETLQDAYTRLKELAAKPEV